jgi:hypothetical protein
MILGVLRRPPRGLTGVVILEDEKKKKKKDKEKTLRKNMGA